MYSVIVVILQGGAVSVIAQDGVGGARHPQSPNPQDPESQSNSGAGRAWGADGAALCSHPWVLHSSTLVLGPSRLG